MTATNPHYFPVVIVSVYWCYVSDCQPTSASACCQWHSRSVNINITLGYPAANTSGTTHWHTIFQYWKCIQQTMIKNHSSFFFFLAYILLIRCQAKIGTPNNGHPGCPFSCKYRHPDAHIYGEYGHPTMKIGLTFWCTYLQRIWVPWCESGTKFSILRPVNTTSALTFMG